MRNRSGCLENEHTDVRNYAKVSKLILLQNMVLNLSLLKQCYYKVLRFYHCFTHEWVILLYILLLYSVVLCIVWGFIV